MASSKPEGGTVRIDAVARKARNTADVALEGTAESAPAAAIASTTFGLDESGSIGSVISMTSADPTSQWPRWQRGSTAENSSHAAHSASTAVTILASQSCDPDGMGGTKVLSAARRAKRHSQSRNTARHQFPV